MARSAKHVWVAARRNVFDLPDCPKDVNEAQYAALLFENECQVFTSYFSIFVADIPRFVAPHVPRSQNILSDYDSAGLVTKKSKQLQINPSKLL